jgi:hypothetical protein
MICSAVAHEEESLVRDDKPRYENIYACTLGAIVVVVINRNVRIYDSFQPYHAVTDANPKLEPSSPRATRVNCCAASRIRFRDRGLTYDKFVSSRELYIRPKNSPSQRPRKLLLRIAVRLRLHKGVLDRSGSVPDNKRQPD